MKRLLFLLPLVLVACSVATSDEPTAVLEWEAPTHYTDGSVIPETQVITYKVFQGPAGATALVAEGVHGLAWTATAGLTPGETVCWTLTAVDVQQGTESDPTGEACKTFAPRIPNPPTDVRVE